MDGGGRAGRLYCRRGCSRGGNTNDQRGPRRPFSETRIRLPHHNASQRVYIVSVPGGKLLRNACCAEIAQTAAVALMDAGGASSFRTQRPVILDCARNDGQSARRRGSCVPQDRTDTAA